MLRWTLHLKGPPKYRYNVAVSVRDRVYYFGGDSVHIDVHVFNTVSLCWKTLTSGPSGRWGHTAVLIEDTAYIWGGYWRGKWRETTEHYFVLYAFDIEAHRWFKPRVSGTVPEGRCGHSACVLEKVMFIHGGRTKLTGPLGSTNNMYKLDTSTMIWSLINTTGTPPDSYGHSATIIGKKMFVFGAEWDVQMFVFGAEWNVQYYNIRVFDTEKNCWLNTPSAKLLPERRCYHSAFTYNGELYILGGINVDNQTNDLWKFSPKTISWKKVKKFSPETSSWKEVKTKRKGRRRTMSNIRHGMCCCMMGDRVILFGGYKGDFSPADDLFILDMSPSLKTLCKLAVIQYGLEPSELPHNIRWELEAMTCNVF